MKLRICNIDDSKAAQEIIKKTGADPVSVTLMARKAITFGLLIENIDNRAAGLIKQYMLSLGGEAAVSREVSCFKKGNSDILILGTGKHIEQLVQKLKNQPFGLKEISERIKQSFDFYETKHFVLRSGSKKLILGRDPVVMGILNITPDSFADGGRYFDAGKAVGRALEMESEGAKIIDIGAESSRPGAKPVDEKEELKRILPVINKLAKNTKVMISADTYKPNVARACLDNGADIINDISALKHNKMAKVISANKVPVILMHMKGIPKNMQDKPEYKDVVGDIIEFLDERKKLALEAGISGDKLVVDPGIGFGKTVAHNLEILKRLKELKVLGLPLMVGASNKSFIGKVLNIADPEKRVLGSIAVHLLSVINGANVVRAHNVKETVDMLKIYCSVQRGISWKS